MNPVALAVLAFALSSLPLAAGQSALGVQSGLDPCTGLSAEQCCAQKLKVAGFKAHGEQLPEKAQQTVDLSCQAGGKTVPPAACRSIAMSRGFSSQESTEVCAAAKAKRACSKDKDCRKCDAELRKLDYKNTKSACFAVTYTPERKRTGVVVLRSGPTGDGSSIEVVRRRTRIQ